MNKILRAFHFTGETLRNGQDIPEIGQWLKYEGIIEACVSGLHASEHPFDALQYAPGPYLHLVELKTDLISHGSPIDKLVGRERKIIASVDATELLWYASRQFALSVAHLWDAPDVVLEFLVTGEESLRDAARAAACAAWAAAWAAARAAACAAWAAAWAAAQPAQAARAAWAAAWAARDAASNEYRDLFASLIDAEFRNYL